MIKMTKARAAALFDALDADGSGEIDDEEFIEGQKFSFLTIFWVFNKQVPFPNDLLSFNQQVFCQNGIQDKNLRTLSPGCQKIEGCMKDFFLLQKDFFFFRMQERFSPQDAWKIFPPGCMKDFFPPGCMKDFFPPGCMKDDVFISLLEAFDGEKIWGEIGLWLHNVKVEIKYAQDMPSMNKIPWNPADTATNRVGIWHDTSSLKLWKVTNQVQKVTSSFVEPDLQLQWLFLLFVCVSGLEKYLEQWAMPFTTVCLFGKRKRRTVCLTQRNALTNWLFFGIVA